MEELSEGMKKRMKVAELRGWTQLHPYRRKNVAAGINGLEAYPPDGDWYRDTPDGDWYRDTPDWLHDIGDAFELINEMVSNRCRPKMSRVAGDEWRFEVNHEQYVMYNENLCAAIVDGYIAWKTTIKIDPSARYE